MSEPILPSQIRAARGLIDWSQETLAKASRVSLSTIKDFEAGRRDITSAHVGDLQNALTKAGVQFIPLNKSGGPGVRLESEIPIISKQPHGVSFETDTLAFRVDWRGDEVFVFLPSTVLDDLDRTNHRGDPAHLASFRKHEELILQKTAQALYAGRLDDRKRLQLRSRDFFPR
jgi:transcriptional regulator with XRE-family HTH domain